MDTKSKCISAVETAAVSNISNLTNDRIEALAGGHGMVNMAVHGVTNVITEELLKGSELTISFADVRRLPVADIMDKAIKTAKRCGADGANAALITACIMYLAGSAAQVGIPAGNRKLGATARMLAGVDRSGVAAIPTAKMNNKISAYPAVAAVYDAMMKGELTEYDGRNVPVNVGGGPLYGHSALGEDHVWPQMAENGARIGTQAMLDAFAGAAMVPHPFTAAVLGSAAILEIIHPDAEVPEGQGTYGRTSSVYLVGRSAVETAGLPKTLHVKVTGEEYDTAKLVGDIGLILKDIGAPSVIGMMAFDEIFSIFEEGIAGFSGGPVNSPLGHIGAYAVIGMKSLVENEGDADKTGEAILKERLATSLNPEVAAISINTVNRKAHELQRGPVTEMLINATEPVRAKAIHDRAEYAYDHLTAGDSIEDVVEKFDDDRIAYTEENAGRIFSDMAGAPVSVKVRKLAPGARRKSKLANKYWSFDPDIDLTVTVGDKVADMNGFVHDIIPRAAHGECEEFAFAIPFGAAVMDDLALNACCIINMTVPAAMAAVLKIADPKEAADRMEKAAYLSRAIPGGKAAATQVGKLAVAIADFNQE